MTKDKYCFMGNAELNLYPDNQTLIKILYEIRNTIKIQARNINAKMQEDCQSLELTGEYVNYKTIEGFNKADDKLNNLIQQQLIMTYIIQKAIDEKMGFEEKEGGLYSYDKRPMPRPKEREKRKDKRYGYSNWKKRRRNPKASVADKEVPRKGLQTPGNASNKEKMRSREETSQNKGRRVSKTERTKAT